MALFHGLLMHVESAVNGRMKKPAADHIVAYVVAPDLQEIRKAWSRHAAVFMHAKSTPPVLLSFLSKSHSRSCICIAKLFVDGKTMRRQTSSVGEAQEDQATEVFSLFTLTHHTCSQQ